jgi:hypothetical protein
VAVTSQDHGCVPMAVAAGLPGGRHRALDLGRRQVLSGATGCDPRNFDSVDRCDSAGDADDPDCICGHIRPGRSSQVLAFSAGGDGVTGLPEQIGRRITPPLFGTRLLFAQRETLLSEKMLDRKIDLAQKARDGSAF